MTSPDDRERPDAEERTEDEIREDFEERQEISAEGRRRLAEKLEQHNATSPDLSAGDIDANWEDKQVGHEHFTGHAPTPDQDIVDNLGTAAGLTYSDTEPLNYGKVADRDRERWELDPRSALDDDDDDESAAGTDVAEDDDEDDADDAEDELLFWDDADDLDAEVEGELADDDDEEDDEEEEDDDVDGEDLDEED